MEDLEIYKTKLGQMSGFELREEWERLRAKYGGKNWTSEEWLAIKKGECGVFLEVQNKRGQALHDRLKKEGLAKGNFKPRSFMGFLR